MKVEPIHATQRPWGSPPKAVAEVRQCTFEGCETVLNRYNLSNRCSVHPHPFRASGGNESGNGKGTSHRTMLRRAAALRGRPCVRCGERIDHNKPSAQLCDDCRSEAYSAGATKGHATRITGGRENRGSSMTAQTREA